MRFQLELAELLTYSDLNIVFNVLAPRTAAYAPLLRKGQTFPNYAEALKAFNDDSYAQNGGTVRVERSEPSFRVLAYAQQISQGCAHRIRVDVNHITSIASLSVVVNEPT